METFYLFLIIFLFVLAVFDLSVGVSNDAVNFMNSAIGSKAASFKVIMVIAAIGIFVGASLSNGMMDIARHGIYQPQHFYFSEIMCILLAVMLTDVVLLDTRSVSDVILDLPARLMVLKRGKIVATSVCQRSVVF